jgi:hypothetical protein
VTGRIQMAGYPHREGHLREPAGSLRSPRWYMCPTNRANIRQCSCRVATRRAARRTTRPSVSASPPAATSSSAGIQWGRAKGASSGMRLASAVATT